MKINETITTIIMIVIAISLVAIVFKLGNSGTPDLRNQISVSGDAELKLQPDQAELWIRTQTTADTAQDSQQRNSNLMTAVQNALTKMGVLDTQIETAEFRLEPVTEWDQQENKYLQKGYRQVHIIKVTTKNLDNVGNILDAAVNAGANGVDQVQFSLSKEHEAEVRTQALSAAMEKAKTKAQAIASGAGVKLGRLITAGEANFYIQPIMRYDMMAKAEAGSMPTPPVQPESVDVRAQVSAVYEIE